MKLLGISKALMAKKKQVKRRQPKVYEIRISLRGTEPLVWRKVLIHEFVDLSDLHMLIQMVMGWENRHLYSFTINEQKFTDEDSALEINQNETEGVSLNEVLGDSKEFSYTYDFGDGWQHHLEITEVLDHDPRMQYPACIGGENACPPEDCGGPPGFDNFKTVIAGKDSPEKNDLLAWVGGYYNPSTFDPNFVNKRLLWADDF